MFDIADMSPDLKSALIGGGVGTTATLLIQFLLYRYRLLTAFTRFKRDLANLDRHIVASLSSLTITPDGPKYFIAARLRFCKFLDGMRSIEDLEWLTRRTDSDRILPTLLAIRNSDTFVEEIAARIDTMSEDQIGAALVDAKTNMIVLHKAIEKLGYAHIKTFVDNSNLPTGGVALESGHLPKPN